MNEEYTKLINKLSENVEKLILLYKQIENDNINLKNSLQEIKEENKNLENKLNKLEEKYEKLKIAKTLETKIGDTGEARYKLNKIIREIDNCIALLNK